MKMKLGRPNLLLPLLLALSILHHASSSEQLSKAFIVRLREQSRKAADHYSVLRSIKESGGKAEESLLYSYKNVINGFSALLSEEEAAEIAKMDVVFSVLPSMGRSSLHTTRSWNFMGLEENLFGFEKDLLAQKASNGADIIIGMLDTGIWPESKSFSDQGMGPVPKRWKGICEEGHAFNSSNCNRKIIGARYYLKGYELHYGELNTSYSYRSPRDKDGHGTHTASTAAGRPVAASSLGSFAAGTAVGGAPLARLAIYKVCWPIPGPNPNLESICFDADILAAIDDAVSDGVDVISISIGRTNHSDDIVKSYGDSIAVGTLHAVKRGVVAVCSAGNSGPEAATLSNLAPWVITVGASSIDRHFDAPLVLGSGTLIMGETVTPNHLKGRKPLALIYAGDAEVPNTPSNASGQCLPNSLARSKVKGKAVLCFRGEGLRVAKGMEVRRAGGAAMILGNGEESGDEIVVDAHVLLATAVSSSQAKEILEYIKFTRKPTVAIGRPATVLGGNGAPAMAAFSSRGPNFVEPNLLKPDITAPGLNILAAWSEASSPTKLEKDNRAVKYNIMSGTSMSCPHVSAIAALLKFIHPAWTSAAIRSSIMTTATVIDAWGQPIKDYSGGLAGPMAFGLGHIRPNHASDPGLIYDASYTAYLLFACASAGAQLDPSFPCPKSPPSPSDLNYPSVAVTAPSNGSAAVTRIVTNVGLVPARYEVTVEDPSGFSLEVQPKVLYFDRQGQRKTFRIKITAKSTAGYAARPQARFAFGSYTWHDGIHHVRSPVVVNIA